MSNSNSIPLPPRVKDLTGLVFGRLTVTGYAGSPKIRAHRWNTVCVCGLDRVVLASNLRSGNTASCGCLRVETVAERRTTHGWAGTPEYTAWRDMWRRCTESQHEMFHLYKDRAPPPEWRSFEKFLADVGPRPSKGLSLDRIDNDKPYGPGNCRWATSHTQNRNMTTNVWVTVKEGHRLILRDAFKAVGISPTAFYYRRRKGQTIEEASNGLLKEAA